MLFVLMLLVGFVLIGLRISAVMERKARREYVQRFPNAVITFADHGENCRGYCCR